MNSIHTTLFEVYLQGVPDSTFHYSMRRLQDDWMDQTGDMKDVTHKDIIQKAKAKYDLPMNSGKWSTKSPNQEKILALEAQLKELKHLTLSTQLANKLNQNQCQGQIQRKDGANGDENQRNNSKNCKDDTNKRLQKLGQRMEEDTTQGQQTKTQAGWQENIALVDAPHEMDSVQT